MWAPGPIDCADPPVDIAAVSPWMLRMVAEVADGVHVHPLNTPTYLRETVLPNLEAGAARAGRRVEDLEMIVPAFLVVGDTEEERSRWREMARVQVAFYGSTPNYAFIFDQLDREGTTDLIRERQRAGDIPGMAAEIDDDLLENFVTEGTWDDIADTIVAKYGGIATRVVSYFTGADVVRHPDAFERWGALARRVRALSSGRPFLPRIHPRSRRSPQLRQRVGRLLWLRGTRGRQNRVLRPSRVRRNGHRIENNDEMEGPRWLSN